MDESLSLSVSYSTVFFSCSGTFWLLFYMFFLSVNALCVCFDFLNPF